MALGAIGTRNAALNSAATATARRLAAVPDASRTWIGRTALKGLVGGRLLG